MLRVTVSKNDSVETWELEGKLSGDWVKELERCWREHPPEAGVAIRLHLKAVSYIDSAGKQLLTEMYGRGVEIKGCGCMARAVAEEIARGADIKGMHVSPKKILAVLLFGVCVLGGTICLAGQEKSQSDRQTLVPRGPVETGSVPGISGSRTREAQTLSLDH
jgi:ABC-type transporter Mla MlaB component